MIISRYHMKKKTVVSAEHQRLSSKEQFSQAKSQLLNQRKSVLLLNLTLAVFWFFLLWKEDSWERFISSLLVSGSNISVCRYPKTPWDSNAHCLNWKIKKAKFREDGWVSMKYFPAHAEKIHCTTGLFLKKFAFLLLSCSLTRMSSS